MSSPIEKQFADALMRVAPDPKAITFEQHPSPDSYLRIDFAVPSVKRGVELDGFTYHEGQGREKATADKARERELDRLGWKITRFSGDEIRVDANACAKEWLELCGITPRNPYPLSAPTRAKFGNKVPSVYLAGKVTKNGWREHLVRGGAGFNTPTEYGEFMEWPVGHIGDLPYTGPFFVRDDHGCTHRPKSHAWVAQNYDCVTAMGEPDERFRNRKALVARCIRAIRGADVVVAWLDDITAYGTFVEIGYALASGRHVIVLSPDVPKEGDPWGGHGPDGKNCGEHYLPDSPLAEAWFTFWAAHEVVECSDPAAWVGAYAQEYR